MFYFFGTTERKKKPIIHQKEKRHQSTISFGDEFDEVLLLVFENKKRIDNNDK